MWHLAKFPAQIRPSETLAYCWDAKQATKSNNIARKSMFENKVILSNVPDAQCTPTPEFRFVKKTVLSFGDSDI